MSNPLLLPIGTLVRWRAKIFNGVIAGDLGIITELEPEGMGFLYCIKLLRNGEEWFAYEEDIEAYTEEQDDGAWEQREAYLERLGNDIEAYTEEQDDE
jgi:hypothetical protein